MIKKPALAVAIFFLSLQMAIAQAPQAINYQGVVRDAAGLVINAQSLNLRLSVHDITATGTIVYQETHVITTNAFGLFNVKIGQGIAQSGSFSAINWGANNKYIEPEIDLGSGFISMGSSQFVSVPYALYAGNGGSSTSYTSGSGIAISGSVITNTAQT